MGKSHEYEELLDKSLHWVGKWCVCSECLKRYEEQVWKDMQSKEYKKN